METEIETEKFCIVPMCYNNNSIKNSLKYRKIWFPVPKNEKQQGDWLMAMGRNSLPHRNVYVCVDHFDENDMYGYEVYQPCEGQVMLKEDAVPHVFKCQKIASNNKTVLELDKFKRRLIRAVARLLVIEKKTEKEVWAELRKETSCDCQLLWSRMRALTLKKLNRLFMADDRTDSIPKPARMSLTDWLLFDLVLVHQKIDLIGQENTPKDSTDDPKPLKDLFEMVKMFNIEGKEGDKLAEAWSSATLYYNNKGHQCSPMLLQRRWYQLKEATRNQFYDFWYSYRGAAKRLTIAEPYMPSQLQAAIARRYKQLVTSPFYDWETLIEQRLVTLPEEFEQKMMERAEMLSKKKIPDDNAPDLVVIEPVIETIDLRLDSDNETEGDKEENSPPTPEVKIKEEPVEMDIDIDEHQLEPPKKSTYDEVLKSTLVEHDRIDNVNEEDDLATEENEISQAIQITLRSQEEPVLPKITCVSGNVDDISAIGNFDEVAPDDDDISAGDGNDDATSFLGKVDETSVLGNVDDSIVHGNVEEGSVLGKVDNTSIRGNVDDTIVYADAETSFTDEVDETNVGVNVDDTSIHDKDDELNENLYKIDNLNAQITNDTVTDMVAMVDDVEINEDISTPATNIGSNESRLVLDKDAIPDNDVLDADIPHYDGLDADIQNNYGLDADIQDNDSLNDGHVPTNDALVAHCIPDNDTNVSENAPDKLMDEDVKPDIVDHSLTEALEVYRNEDVDRINKTPEKDVKPNIASFTFGDISVNFNFSSAGIEFVDDGIAYVDEDNLVDYGKKQIKTEMVDQDEEQKDDTPKIDAKLLMCPIIYTTRLDDMDLFRTQTYTIDHVKDKKMIDIIASKSKPKKEVPADPRSSSEDEDCKENTINDTQKVKPSSFMLQKPRSRTYNPIQLCKNPDFNTRLKRLTVGFFSSPRNRVLLKSCKPLTIDLSKTFESKLVSGTLYLKPSEHDVKPEEIDDSESCQSVSVVPSAMPVQSLIDNSKISDILPITRSHLISPKPPDELSSASERSKVINLPDISEIRRINQRLLTAEVTPIQVQNNTPQVPVSIVATSNILTVPTQKPISFIQRDLQICPPKVVDITNDLLVEKTVANASLTDRNRYRTVFTNTRPIPSTSHNLQNGSKQGHPGRPCKMVNGKRLWPAKASGFPWKPRQIRPDIPWLSKNQEASTLTKKVDETLLTLDTLNKMLYILSCDKDDTSDLQKKKPKTFKKRKKFAPLQNDRIQENAQLRAEGDSNVQVVSESAANSTEENIKCCKPKINIKSASNYPRVTQSHSIDANISEISTTLEDSDQNKDANKKEVQYCCWARQKMLQMLFSRKRITEHGCPYPVCTCCCRILLQQYTANERKLRNAEEKGDSADSRANAMDSSENIETPNEDDKSPVTRIEIPVSQVDTASVGVEKPAVHIEIPVETPTICVPQKLVIPIKPPVIDVETSKQESATSINELINIGDLNSEDGNIPALGSEVSVITSRNLPKIAINSNATFKVTAGNISLGKTTDPFKQRRRSSNKLNVVNQPKRGPLRMVIDGSSVSAATITTPKAKQFTPQPSLSQVLAAKKSNMVKPVKTNIPQNVKQFSPPKNFKEKMIYLNSKQISDKPTDNPIFLGKNKILLTTVKFPPNLKQFEEVKQSLKPSAFLPAGVHLICLPNGIVTYTVDPNIQLTTSQMANLPLIVAAVQQKINSNLIASHKNVPKVGVMDIEVVNLTDEDDDDTPEVIENTNENEKTPPETEVQTTDVDQTNSDNIPQQIFHIETEKNRVDSNNEHKTNNSTDTLTENDHNSIADHNIPIDIQETVQELNTEIPSTSAEQDQHDQTSIQSINIDGTEKNTNEASSGNKSKNILSDLMEMSGIFDEDITPTAEETLPQETVEQIQVPIQPTVEQVQGPTVEQVQGPTVEQVQGPTVEQVQEPVLGRALLKLASPQKVDKTNPFQDNLISVNNVPPIVKSPIGELSPITSLYELKYACLNNGIFFKLDFDTGFLVPINVCMKQHPKPNPNLPKIVPTKAVIDLTDDDDNVKTPSTSTTPSKQNTKSLLISNQVITGSANLIDKGKVKPLKLFKSVQPGILRRISQNQPISPEKEVKCTAANTNSDVNRHKNNRKQYLKKNTKNNKDLNSSKAEKLVTDTNITKDLPKTGPDLDTTQEDIIITEPTIRKLLTSDSLTVKSDNTIINKYLRKIRPGASLTADNNTEKQQTPTDIVSDESSDDEPLSKKAKRKREYGAAPAVVNDMDVQMTEDTPDEAAGHGDIAGDGDTADDGDIAGDIITADASMSHVESMEPGMQYELFMDQSDFEDEEEEHCILGV